MRPHATSVFAEFTQLAVTTGAINLGQGFPDTDGPAEIIEAAVAALRAGHNQYPPGAGVPELRTGDRRAPAPSLRHRPRSRDRGPDHRRAPPRRSRRPCSRCWSRVTSTSRSSRTSTSTPRSVDLCGATRRTVALRRRTSGYTFDPDELRAAVTRRTKVLLLNTPHNPTGKVFDARRAGTDRRAVHRARPGRRGRRGVRAPDLRRRAPRPARDAARDGGADAVDLVVGQDVLVHRLEDRLGDRTGGPGRGDPGREAAPDLRPGGRRSSSPSPPRSALPDRGSTELPRRPPGQARPHVAGLARPGSRCSGRRPPTS